MRTLRNLLMTGLFTGILAAGAGTAHAARVDVRFGGPVVYAAPACPGPGYVWNAGYYVGRTWYPGRWAYRGRDWDHYGYRDHAYYRGHDYRGREVGRR